MTWEAERREVPGMCWIQVVQRRRVAQKSIKDGET